MFSNANVEKLRSVCATKPVVLSLYLPVPLDPAGLRGLAAEAGELMAEAADPADGSQRDSAKVSHADREAVLGALAARGRDWLGHTVAFFASEELGLFEALPLRYPLPARAVLAGRPYIRSLLAAVQRRPDYRVAIADREHAWVLSVSGGRVETIARQVDRGPRSAGFGGWYGLQTYRIQRRITQLGRHHYLQTAAILERAAGSSGRVPLVIGGHHDSVAGLLRALPAEVSDDFAGSFRADPHTLTEAGVRKLAGPVIGRWVARRERELSEEILGAGRLAALGLPACLVAVGRSAVDHLLVPEDGMIPGFACGGCGQLSAGPARCPHCGTSALAVPDLLEEMLQRTLDDNGQVSVIRDAPFSVAAKLRFPVTADV
jgi:Bacterial archaeo-eukaryotic release factor family 10